MTELDTLGKIDLLRERLDMTYEQAKEVLDSQNGNVIDALIAAERSEKNRHERIYMRGSELVDRARGLLRKANVTRIKIKQDEHTILEIPVTAGVVGAMVAPELAILGTMAALATKCAIEVERAPAETLH